MDHNEETLLSNPSTIKHRFFGYDRDEVDRRLNRLLQIIIDGQQVIKIQEGNIRTLEADINDYRGSQAMLRAFFAKAEDEANEIVKRAEEQAQSMEQHVRDIEEQAMTFLAEAKVEADNIRAEADRYVDQKRAEVERQVQSTLRVTAYAENFEKMMGKPKMGGIAGELLGRHILLFLRELSKATEEAMIQEMDQEDGKIF